MKLYEAVKRKLHSLRRNELVMFLVDIAVVVVGMFGVTRKLMRPLRNTKVMFIVCVSAMILYTILIYIVICELT